ncbi:hypothetical protein [Amycolatopsis sp. NPDC021455]|uniref:hypothetical protein n=1 Tax=Amycolatopsis sp. NPDC021455 TaxID=3154901 RepID=UPI0033CB76FD
MTDVAVSRLSLEDLALPVTAFHSGEALDPSQWPVEVAITPTGTDPADEDWHAADWEVLGTARRAVRVIFTVGPGSPAGQRDAGTYQVWIRITAEELTPVLRAENHVIVY